MKDHECTEQRFLDDVKNHQINIVKDDGAHRFVRFKRADNSSYWFDLITWPGFLCISGDCGTYVFSRTEDMFKFFRMNDNDFNKKKDRLLNINPGYWGEKLEAIGRQGYMEFDGEVFEFVDFFDYGRAERFTWHYIWCLYAIVWGIMKYDEAKND